MVAVVEVMVKCKKVEFTSIESLATDPSVAKELKLKVADKGFDWYAVYQKRTIVGFAGIAKIKNGTTLFKGSGIELKYLYVLPEFRKQGFGRELLESIKAEHDCPIKATIMPSTKAFYEKLGFTQVFQRGQYPVMLCDRP